MKLNNILIVLLLFLSAHAIAQPGGERARERIKTLQVAYFTEQLDLTSEEAQEFWPIYNELAEERQNSERQKRQLIRNIDTDFDNLTEQEAKKHISTLQSIEVMQANLDATYSSQIVDIIGAKRYLLLKKAEQDFKKKMLEEFQKRKRGMRRR
jgi:hypothetical protein